MLFRTPGKFLIVGVVAAACSAPTPRAATTAHARPVATPFEGNDLCPMAVEATVVEAADIEGGIGLVFTTMADVAELRRRVRLIARLHAERAGTPTLIVTTDDVSDGARLNIRPLDPERVEHVRVHASTHASVLDASTCPAKLGNEALVSWIVEPEAHHGEVLTRR